MLAVSQVLVETVDLQQGVDMTTDGTEGCISTASPGVEPSPERRRDGLGTAASPLSPSSQVVHGFVADLLVLEIHLKYNKSTTSV